MLFSDRRINGLAGLKISLRGYLGSLGCDLRDSMKRTLGDRAALLVVFLVLLPWASLLILRDNLDWVPSLLEIGAVVVAFWWMSRAQATDAPPIKRPVLESVLAIALVILWAEWRTGICAQLLPFLPSRFSCFDNYLYEIIPKLIDLVIFPGLVLLGAGYRLRSQGLGLDLRSFWIALPTLVGCAAYGFYLHQNKPMDFVSLTGSYFIGAGLPEEFLFRAFLLTRLEAWWQSPAWALFGSSVIFGLTHLPIDYLVFTSRNWHETWITVLTFQMGFGVAFAFAYQRIRNIWPVAILHAMVDAL